MKTHTPSTSAALEAALRHIAKNPDDKVSTVATKFKISDKEIWAWLGAHNKSKKELSSQRIDSVLGEESRPPAKTVPKAVGDRINRALRKPEALSASEVLVPPRPPQLTSNISDWLKAQRAEVVGLVNSYQVTVTPALAASWLLLNHGNRNPSKAKIRRFVTALKADRWVVNGETIKFSITGRLLDGQSRLQAIVLARTPAILEIRAGLPDEAQKSMDIGEARKGIHTLEMMGEKYPNILAAALRWIFRWENNSISYKGGKENTSVLENMEIPALLTRHTGLRASVGWLASAGYKVCSFMPGSEAAFFHYLFGCASKAKRDSFFDALATGLGLSDKSPAYHLREKLQGDRASSKRMGGRERLALVIKAWNAHHAGEKMGQLSFRVTGENREAFPEIAGVKSSEKAA